MTNHKEDVFGNDLKPRYNLNKKSMIEDTKDTTPKMKKQKKVPIMKIALVREGAIFEKANQYAAGYDIKAFNMTIEDGYIKFMLGVKHELPIGYYFEVVHKSGNSKFNSILSNTKGTIDCDFTGEWQARLKIIPQPIIHTRINPLTGVVANNLLEVQHLIGTQFIQLWKEGEIALQAILHKEPKHKLMFVPEDQIFKKGDRGEGGFGSTGNGIDNYTVGDVDVSKPYSTDLIIDL